MQLYRVTYENRFGGTVKYLVKGEENLTGLLFRLTPYELKVTVEEFNPQKSEDYRTC